MPCRFGCEKSELVKELDAMKEYLHTYQESMERKDAVISNLTTALHNSRDKLELMRKFSSWKAQHNESNREVWITLIATQWCDQR